MTETKTIQRRLAAILAADMVGYSRLMGSSEEDTIRRLKICRREIIDPQIAANSGRIVSTSGDGILAEFASAVEAVRCACTIQDQLLKAEETIPEDRKIRFRIGINIGDVVADGNDILGDGVNIAARLEGIAEPGGILVSDNVYQTVRGKLNLTFEDIGRQELKNIPESVKAWRWTKSGIASSSNSPTASTQSHLPEKPSIAVLPFVSMSGEEEQEYFADGMTEDIITELSRMPWFFVIARNSSFAFKGHAVDIKQVGNELGVAYVLEGSVRKAGSRLRVNAQLIDARTGNHIWADRYDRDITDIFEIQDEINQSILGAVSPEYLSSEFKKSQKKDPADLDAWGCVMRGRAQVWKLSQTRLRDAQGLFERAISLSNGRLGLGDLALVHFLDAFYGPSESQKESLKAMVESAEKAVAVDESDPLALTILAWSYLFSLQWDEALAAIERAIQISPNFAPAIGIRGAILSCNDEPDLGIAAANEAIRRSPRDGFMPFWLMALYWAYHTVQDYESAADVALRAARIAPNNPTFRRQLAVAYLMLGKPEESKAAVDQYLELSPNATADDARRIPSRNRDHLERFVRALESAGVPKGDSVNINT